MANLIISSWLLYLGFMPVANLDIDNVAHPTNSNFIQMAGFDFKIAGFFRVWSEIEVREFKSHDIYFDPYRAGFRIGAELLYKDIVLGVSHECDHDIVTGIRPNTYNGVEMAYNRFYAGWTAKFPVHPSVLLKPALFVGFRDDSFMGLKHPSTEVYFNTFWRYEAFNKIIYPRIQGEADFFDRVKLFAGFQPEFSASKGIWSRAGFNTGIELHYRNAAAGAEWMKHARFDQKSWAINELRLYLAFKGKAPLF